MIVILGGGLSGLAAGHTLSKAGQRVLVLEKGSQVGGLARTFERQGFRFDLGGHRLLTDQPRIQQLFTELLGNDLLTVPRRSRILLPLPGRGRPGHRNAQASQPMTMVDYPLRPAGALFGLGPLRTLGILADYGLARAARRIRPHPIVSLEDWVVAHYGRAMFRLYFRDYSEKVWGVGCERISMEWVEKRIDGLSLWQAILSAFSRKRPGNFKTLTDSFVYPRQGIGQLALRLAEASRRAGAEIRNRCSVTDILHQGNRLTTLVLNHGRRHSLRAGDQVVASLPLTRLIAALRPRPPQRVLAAAERMRFRALVTVTIMLAGQRVTDLTWLYLPGRDVPFGRIHEPGNWSPAMAPTGATHLVAEFFCDQGDATWQSPDRTLVALTVDHLTRLGLFAGREILDSCVLRVPHAYPVFTVDYRQQLKVVSDYLSRFHNLQLVGRSGTFSYLNMDHAMASGMAAAERLLARSGALAPCPCRVAAQPSRT